MSDLGISILTAHFAETHHSIAVYMKPNTFSTAGNVMLKDRGADCVVNWRINTHELIGTR